MPPVLDHDWLLAYPVLLRQTLATMARQRRQQLYVAGGPVRDWLLGNGSGDLDLTVESGGVDWARELAHLLGGVFVLLDAGEDVARVVWRNHTIDISAFRQGSRTITEDLGRRDFTINAMAMEISAETGGLASFTIIDPTGGGDDLAARRLRMVLPDAFRDDPLRMIRAVRFMATLGFTVEAQTRSAIASHRALIGTVAAERIAHECELIVFSSSCHAAMLFMKEVGLMDLLFPEVMAGQGMAQPDSHHLDVLGHSLEALRCLEMLLADPGCYFPEHGPVFAEWLGNDRQAAALLRWAALLHDIGKPPSRAMKEGRITFHNHDQAGAAMLLEMAGRLRWRRRDGERIARLVGLHMWPFHLANVRMKSSISRRACLRLSKAVGEDLAGLFLLAMADSLAGNGPGKPVGMEEGLALLFDEVYRVYCEHIKPVLTLPPLITGHDLKGIFNLTPGPLFREILSGLELARVEGTVVDREQALAWVRDFLAGLATPGDAGCSPA